MQLSIIIPIYNLPVNFIQDCIKSIQDAKIPYPYEVIIVNDGSTNEDIKSFFENFHEINTTVVNQCNQGVSAARNIGLKMSSGKYIICLDGDDVLLPEITNAVLFLEKNPSFDIVYCDVPFFGDTNYFLKKREFSLFRLIYISNYLTPSSTLFRRSIIKAVFFNEKLSYSEDKDFFARAAMAGFNLKYLPKPFCRYRKIFNNQSLSQKNIDKREYSETLIKSQFDPHKIISIQAVNEYVINNFKSEKKHFIKLLLILLFPSLFNLLRRKGIYKNNIVVD